MNILPKYTLSRRKIAQCQFGLVHISLDSARFRALLWDLQQFAISTWTPVRIFSALDDDCVTV